MSLADQQWCPTSVQVTVLQARGLRIKGKSGTNDAYAVIQVGKDKYQTSVVEKCVAPVWKEEASFDLPQLQQGGRGGSTLHVHVLHRALVGPDKLLGQAVINLLQLSEDKTRNKTEWFKLLDKTGKPDKDRGEVLVDIQFMRNNMTASMFDLSAAGKSRSRLGKFKDKVRGKKKESDSVTSVVPSFTQVLTDSEEEANGDDEAAAGKAGKHKKHKIKSLFSPKSNLQKSMSQSMSVLPGKNSTLSSSQSSGLNVESSEGKKKFKFMIHKRSGSSDGKDSSSGHEKQAPVEQSNLCINGSHIYCEEPPPQTSRISSNFSLSSSGHGSMEDVPENSPPSESQKAMGQYSPWEEEEDEDEEEEEEEEEMSEVENRKESVNESKRTIMEEDRKEEKIRRQQKKLESLAEDSERQEEEETRRAEEEEVKRFQEEKVRREKEKKRQEEEERVRMEEERERLAEEKRLQELERRKLEDERIRIEKEKKKRLEEEERAKMEAKRREEEQKLAEEKRLEEEKRAQEEKRWQEEEAKMAEEKRLQELERRKLEEERIRIEEEKKKRLEEEERAKMEEKRRQEKEQKLAEEKRLKELERRKLEEERIRIEEEKKKRLEEEERAKMEEKRRQEKEQKLAEEKRLKELERRKLEEERIRIEEEKKRLEEEERVKMEEKRRREEQKVAEEKRLEEKRAQEEKRRQEEKAKMAEEKRLQELERMKLEEERIRIEEEKTRLEEERAKMEERRRREEEQKLAEKRRLEEEERVRKEKEERRKEEERKQKEEELLRKQKEEREKKRIQLEQERSQREEEERIRKEEEKKIREEQERARKEKEEYERLEEEKMQQEEQRRIEEEEKVKKEKEERVRMEEEMVRRKEEKERARKEKEETERLEEQRLLKEQERRRIEEEQKVRREEEERIRREKKEVEPRKLEKSTRNAEEPERKENKTEDEGRAAGEKSKASSSAEVTSTNPFDENFSCNPFKEIPESPHGSTAKVATVQQRCQSAVSSVGSKTVSLDEKDLISTQREKRPAPQPPGRSQAEKETHREQDVSARHLAQITKQSKDKDVKTVSVPPQRSVQMIAPLSRSPTDSKNSQSLMQSNNANGTTDAAKHSKRPAPSIPHPTEEKQSSEQKTSSNLGGAETKQVKVVYGLNPFEDDDDEDESELTWQDDTTVSGGGGSVRWPTAGSQTGDKDAASQPKIKSLKMAHAPPPPAKDDIASRTLMNPNTEGSHAADDRSAAAPDNSAVQACDTHSDATSPVRVQESLLQESQSLKLSIVEAGVKKDGAPTPSRRLQPVRPLNPLEQQGASVVQGENQNKSTGILSGVQDKTKVSDSGMKGPYSQLTREELISLVLKQESQLSERDHKISGLEQYIDNLLVRVIEEKPSILMSMSTMKKAA